MEIIQSVYSIQLNAWQRLEVCLCCYFILVLITYTNTMKSYIF